MSGLALQTTLVPLSPLEASAWSKSWGGSASARGKVSGAGAEAIVSGGSHRPGPTGDSTGC